MMITAIDFPWWVFFVFWGGVLVLLGLVSYIVHWAFKQWRRK